jgi:hypothetical protein
MTDSTDKNASIEDWEWENNHQLTLAKLLLSHFDRMNLGPFIANGCFSCEDVTQDELYLSLWGALVAYLRFQSGETPQVDPETVRPSDLGYRFFQKYLLWQETNRKIGEFFNRTERKN